MDSSILETLTRFDVPFRTSDQDTHATAGWVQVECPYCEKGSGKFHLGINLLNHATNCYKCGRHSTVGVLVELTGQPYAICRQLLEEVGKAPGRLIRTTEPSGRLRIPFGVEALRRPHRTYLEGRGFNPDYIAQMWEVQGISIAPRLGWRLWIPIHRQGRIVSWTTRAIGNDKVRYKSAPVQDEAIPARHLLYGSDYVRHSVIVCEGPTDVWRIGPGAVATMGIQYSREQMLLLAEYPVRAICFDKGRIAQRQSEKLVHELLGFPGETYAIEIETGQDVADAEQGEIDAIRGMFLERGLVQSLT